MNFFKILISALTVLRSAVSTTFDDQLATIREYQEQRDDLNARIKITEQSLGKSSERIVAMTKLNYELYRTDWTRKGGQLPILNEPTDYQNIEESILEAIAEAERFKADIEPIIARRANGLINEHGAPLIVRSIENLIKSEMEIFKKESSELEELKSNENFIEIEQFHLVKEAENHIRRKEVELDSGYTVLNNFMDAIGAIESFMDIYIRETHQIDSERILITPPVYFPVGIFEDLFHQCLMVQDVDEIPDIIIQRMNFHISLSPVHPDTFIHAFMTDLPIVRDRLVSPLGNQLGILAAEIDEMKRELDQYRS